MSVVLGIVLVVGWVLLSAWLTLSPTWVKYVADIRARQEALRDSHALADAKLAEVEIRDEG